MKSSRAAQIVAQYEQLAMRSSRAAQIRRAMTQLNAIWSKKAGGDDFSVFIRNPDIRSAFKQAVDKARHYAGSGGYTGTIAEKGSYELRSKTPMTINEANRFMEEDIDQNDKWGPAFALPIIQGSNPKIIGYLFYGIASS